MTLPALFQGIYDPLPMYQLSTLCRVNYSPTEDMWQMIGAGLRRHLQRIELGADGMAGFPRTNVLVLNDHNVIVIGGTVDIPFWINNIASMVAETLNEDLNIAVGTAFNVAANQLATALAGAGVNLSRPTILTGHSLGGALATMLAFRWLSLGGGKDLSTVTFGAPKVGTRGFYSAIPSRHVRCIYNEDLVTQLPSTGIWIDGTGLSISVRVTPYSHGGTCLWIDKLDGTINRLTNSTLGGPDLTKAFSSRGGAYGDTPPLSRLNLQYADHAIKNYVFSWRSEVNGAPRFTLEGFDQANGLVNTAKGEDWPDASYPLLGMSLDDKPLPEDPPELLPFPAIVPAWDPTAPPPALPPITSPAWEQERTLRRRRGL